MNQIMKIAHPCFDEGAHFKIFRIHLPVALKCNIKCKYCDRLVGAHYHHSRPGISKQIISPTEALELVDQFLVQEQYNNAVVGIAGPGEALYNEETFETLSLVATKYPNTKLCVCSNGLLLNENAERLFNLGVRYLTVTINAVSPVIGKNVYSWINYNHKIYRGIEAASILIRNQLAGVEKSVKLGMLVKVNSVLIPAINDFHMVEITEKIKRAGVYIHNIMPLIPLSELKHVEAPTCDLIREVRNKSEKVLPQFRLCKQCRADACSIPGLE
jgi:nitrogen fixation protein NifB